MSQIYEFQDNCMLQFSTKIQWVLNFYTIQMNDCVSQVSDEDFQAFST